MRETREEYLKKTMNTFDKRNILRDFEYRIMAGFEDALMFERTRRSFDEKWEYKILPLSSGGSLRIAPAVKELWERNASEFSLKLEWVGDLVFLIEEIN